MLQVQRPVSPLGVPGASPLLLGTPFAAPITIPKLRLRTENKYQHQQEDNVQKIGRVRERERKREKPGQSSVGNVVKREAQKNKGKNKKEKQTKDANSSRSRLKEIEIWNDMNERERKRETEREKKRERKKIPLHVMHTYVHT